MARKRDVPFKRGKSKVWAGAIIYAIGSINFLSDKSFEPYLPLSDISKLFNVSNSTVSNKAREIRKMFRLGHFDQEFSTDEMRNSNPLNEMVDDYSEFKKAHIEPDGAKTWNEDIDLCADSSYLKLAKTM